MNRAIAIVVGISRTAGTQLHLHLRLLDFGSFHLPLLSVVPLRLPFQNPAKLRHFNYLFKLLAYLWVGILHDPLTHGQNMVTPLAFRFLSWLCDLIREHEKAKPGERRA